MMNKQERYEWSKNRITKALNCCEGEEEADCENCPYHHDGDICKDLLVQDVYYFFNDSKIERKV